MFINIITPCSRPQNLQKISESINIPKRHYRWIVVFDAEFVPDSVPDNCEAYAHVNNQSIYGNAQRNFALDLVKNGYVYFNDDDTTIHPNLYESVKKLNEDIIHFGQSFPNGDLRLTGINVKLYEIDSHNFLVNSEIIGKDRWILNNYCADGLFAELMYSKAKTRIYIPKVLSIYNALR